MVDLFKIHFWMCFLLCDIFFQFWMEIAHFLFSDDGSGHPFLE